MSQISEAIYYQLSHATGLGAPIYHIKAPDNTAFPFIVYQKISAIKSYMMEGGGEFTSGLYQFDIYSNAAAGASAQVSTIARKINGVFSGLKGTIQGVDIQGFFQENEIETYDPDIQVKRIIQTYRVEYIEAKPLVLITP